MIEKESKGAPFKILNYCSSSIASDYYGMDESMKFIVDGIEISSTPRIIRNSFIPTLSNFMKIVNEKDEFIGLINKDNCEIKTDKGVIEFPINKDSYQKFTIARANIYELARKRNITILSAYKGAHKEITVDFGCGHEISTTPNALKKGACCSYCLKKGVDYGQESFKKALGERGHEVLSAYVSTNNKILIDFKCGHEPHWMTPQMYKQGQNCPRCSHNNKENAKEEFLAMLKENGHALIGDYERGSDKVLIDFKCGHPPHRMVPSKYKQGQRCPQCTMSRGERVIRKYCIKNNIEIVFQYSIADCRNVNALVFDFAVMSSEKLVCLIEFDGIQHFEPVEFFGGEQGFIETRQRDNVKNEFCKNNNIPLLRIPYWDLKMTDEILNDFFIELNVI